MEEETKGQETMIGPKKVPMRGPKEVTTKDQKRVEQSKKLQEHNRRRKELEAQNQYVIRVF